MIQAMVFDLDGTLFDRDLAIRTLANSQYGRFRAHLGKVPPVEYVRRLIELDDHGMSDKRVVYAKIADSFDLSSHLASALQEDFWSGYHEHSEAFPGVLDTLKALRDRGQRVSVVTNGRAETQNRTIDEIGIRALLDGCLISEVERLKKPDPRIFRLAASRLGVRPSECVFVGDHPESDVAGSKAAGMNPVWKSVPHWDAPEDVPRIHQLAELLDLTFAKAPPAA